MSYITFQRRLSLRPMYKITFQYQCKEFVFSLFVGVYAHIQYANGANMLSIQQVPYKEVSSVLRGDRNRINKKDTLSQLLDAPSKYSKGLSTLINRSPHVIISLWYFIGTYSAESTRYCQDLDLMVSFHSRNRIMVDFIAQQKGKTIHQFMEI